MAISTIEFVLQARALGHRFAAPIAASIGMSLASLENDFGKRFLHRQREFSVHSRFALAHDVVASVSICVRHTSMVVITSPLWRPGKFCFRCFCAKEAAAQYWQYTKDREAVTP